MSFKDKIHAFLKKNLNRHDDTQLGSNRQHRRIGGRSAKVWGQWRWYEEDRQLNQRSFQLRINLHASSGSDKVSSKMSHWSNSLKEVGFRSILIVAGIIWTTLALIWWFTSAPSGAVQPGIPQPESQSIKTRIGPSELSGREGFEITQRSEPRVEAIQEASPTRKADLPPIVEESPDIPEPPSVPATPVGDFTVQVGAFKAPAGAKSRAQELEKSGVLAIIRVPNGNDELYRLYVGQFRTAEDAAEEMARLKRLGIEGFVRRVQ